MPKVTQAHRDARRAQILDAASICFARAGFHETTMHDIVRQAQLSPGAIYLYFASKDEIITALTDERHAREQQAIAAACEASDLRTALRALTEEFLGTLQTPEERVQRRLGIQIWAESLHNDAILPLMQRGVDEPRRLLTSIVEAAQRRGELPTSLDAEALSRVMIALFQGFILQQAWDEELRVEPYIATVEAIVETLLRDHALMRNTESHA